MTFSEPVLVGLLEELLGHWVRNRAPVARALNPALSLAEVEALGRQAGVVVPPELVTLWTWHDGARYPATVGPGFWWFPSLEEALRIRRRQLDFVPLIELSPGVRWSKGFLPFMSDGANMMLFADAEASADGSSPVWYYEPVWETHDGPRMPSVTSMVRQWVELFELDAFHWNAEEDEWERVDERIPLSATLTKTV
jgi:hypothetical protein